jgi:urea transport system substrate-binding protein
LASILLFPPHRPAGRAEIHKEGDIEVLTKTWYAAIAAAFIAGGPIIATAQTAGTIKVGVLHSLSGTMAISETTLKDTILMMVDDLNKKGGLLGKKVEAVVVDPASNWPLFAEKARDLLSKDKVAAVFGCWTSVSRKSVLPVFEELNGLLFYPVQYEGEESSNNVFYTGAAPNQQAIPAVELFDEPRRWLGQALGPGGYRLCLPPHDQQDP